MLLFGWLRRQEPLEGRWCPDCKGLLAYKRRWVGKEIVTFIWCWSCGWRRPVNAEPNRAPVWQAAAQNKEAAGKDGDKR